MIDPDDQTLNFGVSNPRGATPFEPTAKPKARRASAAPPLPERLAPLPIVIYPDVDRAYRAFMRRTINSPLWSGV